MTGLTVLAGTGGPVLSLLLAGSGRAQPPSPTLSHLGFLWATHSIPRLLGSSLD